MFFGSAPTVIFLKSKSLEIYSPKTKGVEASLDFPPNYEKDLEIIDQEKFENLISSFLTKLNLKDQQIIIAISSEDLFEKNITSDQVAKEKSAIEHFFNTVPFDPQKIAKLQIKTKNGTSLVATNKNLYESIIHVLQKIQTDIQAVVPATLFGVSSTSSLSTEDLKKITNNKSLLKSSNFIHGSMQQVQSTVKSKKAPNPKEPENDEPVEIDEPDSSAENQSNKKSPVVVGGLAFMAVGFVIILIMLHTQGYLKYFFPDQFGKLKPNSPQTSSKEVQIENTDEDFEEASNEADLQEESEDSEKTKLTIQILNGSGIPGQAGNISNILQSLDYSDIEVGNADSADNQSTTISYGSNASETFANEIKSELEKTLTSVTIQKSPDQENFDIIIISGQPN